TARRLRLCWTSVKCGMPRRAARHDQVYTPPRPSAFKTEFHDFYAENMKTIQLIITIVLLLNLIPQGQSAKKDIYHSGWIDLNKNGRMDVYENPKIDVEKRITDLLSQMNLDEKTCQTATLYGYNRVLKDELPTPDWKNQIWKDGI